MSADTLRAHATDLLTSALLPTPHAKIPIRFENQAFSQPTGAWLSFYTVSVDVARASIGTRNSFQKTTEYIVVEVYVPADSGTKTLNFLMDLMAKTFQEQNYSLSDGDSVTTYTSKQKKHGGQFGFFLGTVMTPVKRRIGT